MTKLLALSLAVAGMIGSTAYAFQQARPLSSKAEWFENVIRTLNTNKPTSYDITLLGQLRQVIDSQLDLIAKDAKDTPQEAGIVVSVQKAKGAKMLTPEEQVFSDKCSKYAREHDHN